MKYEYQLCRYDDDGKLCVLENPGTYTDLTIAKIAIEDCNIVYEDNKTFLRRRTLGEWEMFV